MSTPTTPLLAAPPGEPSGSSTAGQRIGKEPGVVGQERPLVRGQVVLVIDRLDRAHRLARPAVDALVGMDVERAGALVDAVDRAFLDARAV